MDPNEALSMDPNEALSMDDDDMTALGAAAIAAAIAAIAIVEPVVVEPVIVEPAVVEPVNAAPVNAAPASAEPPETSDAADRVRRSPRVTHWLAARKWAAAAILVIAVLAAALVVTQLQLGRQNTLNGDRASAMSAARTYAVELGSYNYQHLSQDFDVVKSHSTPSFRASFTQSSDALGSLLSKYHATATATAISAGVFSASGNEAVVLVFLNQQVTNTAKAGGASSDHSRVEITLINSGGRWLIDKVRLL
jgi:Mce-associated membrane protein